MARTHKSDRIFQHKLDQTRYQIRVLEAVGDVMEFAKVVKGPLWDTDNGCYVPVVTERVDRAAMEHNVKREDVLYRWQTL